MDLEDFKARLTEAEKASGVDQKSFAASLGLGPQSYRNMLRATLGPSVSILYRIAEAKGERFVSWLLYGTMDDKHPADPIGVEFRPASVTSALKDTSIVPLCLSGIVEWQKGTPGLSSKDHGGHIALPNSELGWRVNHSLMAVKLPVGGGGNNMPAGALIVVDVDDRRLRSGGVFVIASPDRSGNWGVYRAYPMKGGFALLRDELGTPPVIVETRWESLCVGAVAFSLHRVD